MRQLVLAVGIACLVGVGSGCGVDDLDVATTSQALSLSPSSHTFANTIVGASSSEKKSTLNHLSVTPITVNSIVESCGSYSLTAETVYYEDGVESARVTFSNGDQIYRANGEFGLEQVEVEIFMTFSPTARGATAPCTVNVTTSSTDPTITLNGTGVAPQMDTSPTSLSFTSRRINTTSATQSFTITNNGDTGQNLSLTSFTVSPNSEDWVVSLDTSTSIAPNTVRTGTVSFSPKAAGAQNATLTINSNDPVDSNDTVALTGTGLTATVATSVGSLTIPSGGAGTVVNQTSTNTLTVNNTATTNGTTLSVSSVTFSGSHPADFSITSPTLPTTIAAGVNATFAVQCRPSATGTRTATMTVNTDADNAPQSPTVTLTCTGIKPDISVSPSPVNFTTPIAPGSSANLTLTVSNASGAQSSPLTVTALTRSGTNSADFSTSGVTLPFTVPVGGSQNVTVTFAPTALGTRTANLAVVSNDVETPTTNVTLNGTGQAPEITLTAPATNSLDFGSAEVGTQTGTQAVTVRNDGNSNLTINSVSFTAGATGDYVRTGPGFPATIAAGNSSTWNISCLPTTTGNRAATLAIASNDTSEPTTNVSLACNGVQGVLTLISPTSPVDFGTVRTGDSSDVFLTVRNTGTAPADVNAASIGGGDYAIFSPFSPPPVFTLSEGASATIGVRFSPTTTTGTLPGSLTIAYEATSLVIPLTGVGTSAIVSTSVPTLAFSSVVVNTQSTELSVDVENDGTADLTVFGATIGGTDAASFFITSGPFFPAVVSPTGRAQIGVVCIPPTIGTKTATLSVDTDADNTPQDPTVTLTCTGAKPDLTVSPSPASFGNVVPGTPTPMVVTISNANLSTTSALTVYGLTLYGPDVADFALAPATTPFTLMPGGTLPLTVTFTPSDLGVRTAYLEISSDDLETAVVEVVLTGNGFAPELALIAPASASLAFGDVQVGATSATQAVTVENAGTATLSITSVALIGPDAGEFVLTGTTAPPTINLGASATASWNIACNPAISGLRQATLRIVSNDASEPDTDVAVTCTGTQGNLVVTSPATPIGFGAIAVGSQSTIVTVTLQNAGGAPVTINSAASVGPGPFSIVTNFSSTPLVLNPGNTTTLALRFTPTADGTASNTLTVSYDATVLSVGLNGTGNAAIVSATPPGGLALGEVLVGSTATTGTITLTNSGSALLDVTSATKTGLQAGDFVVVSPTFPLSVAAGASVGVTIRCTPSAIGARNASVQFDTDADNVPQDPSIGLSCTGVKPDITVTPPTVSFANVAPGGSAQQTVTISNANAATTSTLSVTGLALAGGQPGDYQLSPSTPFTLGAGESQDVTVTFTPQALGTRATTFTITSTDQETPNVNVALTGNGSAPEVTLTAPASGSHAFGDVKVGTTSSTTSATVQNDGNATLTIASVTLIGTNPGDFTVTGPTTPHNLAGAGTATWTLACAPTTTGGRSATLRLTTNDTSEPIIDVPLTCNGTQGLLVVFNPATPIAFATTDVGSSSAEVVVTLRNQGTAAIQVTGASVSGAFAISTPLSQATPFSLAVNATATLGLRFTPTADGLVTGTLTVTNDVVALTEEVRGTGRAALAGVSSAALAFDNVLVGSTLTTRTFNLQNTGSAVLNLTAISKTGANPADFVVVSPGLPTTVAAAGSVTVTVRCTPTASGARTATLTLDTDGDNVPQDPVVSMTCNGQKPDILVAPSPVVFAAAQPGTPQQLELTVSNAGGAGSSALSVSALALGGTHAADFGFSPTGAFTLDPGASRVLTITFTPSSFGAKTASLTLTSDDQETPTTVVPLTGSGSAPEITIVQPAGATIPFGDVKVGTTGTVTNVQVRNDGNEDLDVTGVLLVGAQASSFVVTGAATPATLTAAASSTWAVACRPTSLGAKTATLEIHSTDADEAIKTLALTCNGTSALLVVTSPVTSPIQFAATRVGEMSPEITVIFQNTGTAPLTINGPALASAAEFVVSTQFPSTPPFNVLPGGTTTLGVRFLPSDNGDLDGTLDLNWDATSLSVPLRGPGRLTEVSITPVANPDGDVVLGAVCVGQARVVGVRVQNVGTASFVVTEAAVTGDAFSVGALTPATLTPGTSVTIDVTVDPELGDATGQLDITTDIPGVSVYSLSLVATGIATGVGVIPDALAFPATLPDEVSPAQTVTVTNCEVETMSIGQVALEGDDAGDFGLNGPTPPPAIVLDPSESAQWSIEFHPDTEGGSEATLHLSHDLDTGGGVIDVPIYGWGGTGGPDAGVGPDAMLDPDAEPAPDGGDPAVDQQSYYACSTGAPSSATLLLLLGALALATRRRRPRPLSGTVLQCCIDRDVRPDSGRR